MPLRAALRPADGRDAERREPTLPRGSVGARNPRAIRHSPSRRARFRCYSLCISCILCSNLFSSSYNSTLLSRSALMITETELKVMAKLAIIGLSRMPKNG